MKKFLVSGYSFLIILYCGLFLIDFSVYAQETAKTASTLPENINSIITHSCTPCHTSKGGILSRTKLNFTEWSDYSAGKQKEKAEKMYKVLRKGIMPHRAARETRPEIIPAKDQIESIRDWADSLKGDDK
jgi:hypothetical protein